MYVGNMQTARSNVQVRNVCVRAVTNGLGGARDGNCEYAQHSTYRMLIKGKVARTSKLMWKECGRAI